LWQTEASWWEVLPAGTLHCLALCIGEGARNSNYA